MTQRGRSDAHWEHSVPGKVEAAIRRLEIHGYAYSVTAEELIAWLKTDTPYPNPDPVDLLDNPYLVVHEIVEIEETKRMGLRITKDVIMNNMARINDAHFEAARVEFDVAQKEAAFSHIRARYRDLRAWCEDPLLTPIQRKRYEEFRRSIEEILTALGKT